jgi:hypothetical protein
MTGNHVSGPDACWDRAGEAGYAQATYRSSDIEVHVRGRLWQAAIDLADQLEVPRDGHVLDVGCGDSAFTNQMLAPPYRLVEGLDKSAKQSPERKPKRPKMQPIALLICSALITSPCRITFSIPDWHPASC